MKVYESELKNWSKFKVGNKNVPLTPDQLQAIDLKAKQLLKESISHPTRHNLLGISVILLLLVIDMLSFTLSGTTGLVVMTVVHGFILYSLTNYTMHEGAGHKRIILGNPTLAFLVNNVSRLYFADPEHYKLGHPSHHQHLGTANDMAFTQMVEPKRIAKSFLPGAGLFEFNDYKIHSGDTWTKSKITSLVIGLSFSAVLFFIGKDHQSPAMLIFMLLVGAPWISFSLDRLRESSEHMLVHSDDLPEARELGNTFWGYVVGGGPWGQPCHLSHHIATSLTWYQQLRLSNSITKIMTLEQRKHFFVEDGFLGYPKKFIQLMKINAQIFANKSQGPNGY